MGSTVYFIEDRFPSGHINRYFANALMGHFLEGSAPLKLIPSRNCSIKEPAINEETMFMS